MISQEQSFTTEKLVKLMQFAVKENAFFRFKAEGYSMFPFIQDGDLIMLSPVGSHSFIFGKVAVFLNPGLNKLVVHRVIGRSKGCYILKGDATNCIDGLIPIENILGVVTEINRRGKTISFGFGYGGILAAFLNKSRVIFLFFRCWKILPRHLRNFIKSKILL